MKDYTKLRLFIYSVVVSFVVCGPLRAETDIDSLVVFGDSLSDPGNAYLLTGEQSLPPFSLIPDAAYAIGGHHFTNGPTWVEVLSKKLHTRLRPAFAKHAGFNFAVGGSRARAQGPTHLSVQVASYLQQAAVEQEDGLVIIMIGANDIRDAIAAYAADATGQTSQLILTAALQSIADNVAVLLQAGARRFLFVNVPDVSLAPAVIAQGPGAQFLAKALSVQFNQGLEQIADNARIGGAKIFEYDLFSLLHQAVLTPERFNLAVVDRACITPDVVSMAICAHPNQYLFWDGVHPTRKAHRVIAREVTKLLEIDD